MLSGHQNKYSTLDENIEEIEHQISGKKQKVVCVTHNSIYIYLTYNKLNTERTDWARNCERKGTALSYSGARLRKQVR